MHTGVLLRMHPDSVCTSCTRRSPTHTQGNIAKWKKTEGQEIAAGDVLAEVETDKATIDWESMDDGILAKILVPEGTKDIAVGTPVAIVVEEAEDAAAFADYQPGAGMGMGEAMGSHGGCGKQPQGGGCVNTRGF